MKERSVEVSQGEHGQCVCFGRLTSESVGCSRAGLGRDLNLGPLAGPKIATELERVRGEDGTTAQLCVQSPLKDLSHEFPTAKGN